MVQKLPASSFENINNRLSDNYGRTENLPNFRLVWSDDQTQKRWTDVTKEGIQLLHPEVREMRKYPDIRERYVLERLISLPDMEAETGNIAGEVLTYQPIWTFEVYDAQKNRVYIAPSYGACRFVVQTVLNAIEQAGNYTKYKDTGETQQEYEQRIKGLENELFGNESAITDALGRRQGVAFGQGSSPNSSKGMFRK